MRNDEGAILMVIKCPLCLGDFKFSLILPKLLISDKCKRCGFNFKWIISAIRDRGKVAYDVVRQLDETSMKTSDETIIAECPKCRHDVELWQTGRFCIYCGFEFDISEYRDWTQNQDVIREHVDRYLHKSNLVEVTLPEDEGKRFIRREVLESSTLKEVFYKFPDEFDEHFLSKTSNNCPKCEVNTQVSYKVNWCTACGYEYSDERLEAIIEGYWMINELGRIVERTHEEGLIGPRLDGYSVLRNIPSKSWFKFEKLTAFLLNLQGWDASVTHKSEGSSGIDGGVDVRATKDDRKLYLQAKHFIHSDTLVGRPEVQQLFGVALMEAATDVVFATSSSYSQYALGAVESTKMNEAGQYIKSELWDGKRIGIMIDKLSETDYRRLMDLLEA